MNYLWLTLKHKWYVLVYGLKIGCPLWRLITHDINKLSLAEYPAYQKQFFGTKDDQLGFQTAWLHHQNREDHHPEYWMQRTAHDRGNPRGNDYTPLPMPEGAVLEMLADWQGASHAYGGKPVDVTNWPWLDKSWRKTSGMMHGDTKKLVMKILFRMGRKYLCP